MNQTFTAKSSIVINAPVDKVWEALTNPKIVKQWLFGTEMLVSAWKIGGSITYKGEWQGKPYEDKGKILEIVPHKKFSSTYWSSFSGLPDNPENYQKVTYELENEGIATKITITQEGNKTEEAAKHSETNWKMTLESMKKLLEKPM